MRWPLGVSAFLLCLLWASSRAGAVVADETAVDDPAPASALPLAILMVVAAVASIGVLRSTGVLRPGGLDTAKREPGGVGALVWFVAAAGVLLAQSVGAGVGAAAAPAGDDPLVPAAVSMAGAYTLAIAVAVAVIWGLGAVGRRAGLRMHWPDIPLGIGAFLLVYPVLWCAGVAAQAVYHALSARMGWAPPEALAHDTLRTLVESPRTIWWWVAVGGVIIAAPVVEEVVYRGFVQTALRRVGLSGWVSVLIVSAGFTLMHAQVAGAHALVVLFILSLALGATFERTGRLGTAIALHASFNAVNILIALRSGG